MKFLILFLSIAITSYSKEISLNIKLEYASRMNEAFSWQAEGHSTTAFAVFDDGLQKAYKAGESSRKLEPIRQMFVWYRTYGAIWDSWHLLLTIMIKSKENIPVFIS